MKNFIVACTIALAMVSCTNNSHTPDVSGIPVKISTYRFEQKLFDTTAPTLNSYLLQLQSNHPAFTAIFLNDILNADPNWPADTTASYVNLFVRTYRPVFNDAQKIFSNFTPYEKEMAKAIRYVKHYFPAYHVPEKIITYIGPADGYGDAITKEAFLIGLQYHLGKDNQLYKTDIVRQVYPEYISNRFEASTIVVNSMKNIVTDIYPEKENDKPLVQQMIEKGKRLYILSALLPEKDEHLLIGYTDAQLKDCYKHEAAIWDLFVKNNYLQSIDKNIFRNFIEEGPKTQELGEGAPGNAGSFAGWQIVKKYMQKNPATTLQQLIALSEETIFEQAKYKP
ncbi:MAG: hypothetical protein RL172_2008 [Bacteroidota bacterium]|jgi:hypothetical protein